MGGHAPDVQRLGHRDRPEVRMLGQQPDATGGDMYWQSREEERS
jgi:hypothetical protein